jgi:hypothetical protein
MATLAVPSIEVLLAMEELGLRGWLRGRRAKVRSVKIEAPESAQSSVEQKGHTEHRPAMGGATAVVGLAMVAAGAGVLAVALHRLGRRSLSSHAELLGLVGTLMCSVGAMAVSTALDHDRVSAAAKGLS